MSKRMMVLVVAGLAAGVSGAYAQDQSQSSNKSGNSAQSTTGQSGAADRTTQGNEPGPGVSHGNNEGGSDRRPTAEQPTAAPGTGDVSDTNKKSMQSDPAHSDRKRSQGDAGNAGNTAPDVGSGNSSRPR